MTAIRTPAFRFGWVSLLQDLGSKMVTPLLPLFLTLSLGASPFVVGLTDAAGTATAALMAAVAGRVAAGQRLLPMVRFGYGLSSLAKLALAATTGWGQVLAVRVADRAGKGIRDAPRDMILANCPASRHGRVFGVQQALDKTGGFLGPLAGLTVYWASNGSFHAVFIVAFLPCLLSVALLWGKGVPRADPVANTPVDSPAASHISASQRRALAVVGLHALAFVPTSLLLLRASAIGMSVGAILAAYALLRLATALASYPAGVLTDRVRGAVVVSAGAVCTASAMLALSVSTSHRLMWAGLALVGAADALTRAPVKAWLLSLGPAAARGTVLGNRSAVVSVASLTSGVLAGALWGESGELPLTLAAATSLCAGVAVWSVHPYLGSLRSA